MEFCTLFLGSPCHLGIIQPRELVPLLPGDHEGRQVGGVDGEEDESKESPDICHQPGRVTLRAVNIDCSFEEDHPDQPESSDK